MSLLFSFSLRRSKYEKKSFPKQIINITAFFTPFRTNCIYQLMHYLAFSATNMHYHARDDFAVISKQESLSWWTWYIVQLTFYVLSIRNYLQEILPPRSLNRSHGNIVVQYILVLSLGLSRRHGILYKSSIVTSDHLFS